MGTCAQTYIYTEGLGFFANPRRKGNTKLSLCKAAYFILMATLIYPTNPILKKTENILLYSSNKSSKARFTRKEHSACWFEVVPAGDIKRTSQCIDKILHFCLWLPSTYPRDAHPPCIWLGKEAGFKSSAKNTEVFVLLPNPTLTLY